MVYIYLDTNVLLDLYSYSKNTINSIINGFIQIGEYSEIVIPKRAYEEFLRHYRACRQIRGGRNNVEFFYKKFKDLIEQVNSLLDKLPRIHEQFESNIGDLISIEKNSLSTFEDNVNVEIDRLRTSSQPLLDDTNDPIFGFVESHKPKSQMTLKEKITISIWGEQRIKIGLKPGRKDYAKKEGFDKYGDIYIWKEILDSPSDLARCYFLTDEKKSDWWKENGSNDFDPFLVKEYEEEHPKTQFIAVRFPEFCRMESTHFDKGALTEINSLRTQVENALKDKNSIAQLISDNAFGYDFRSVEDSLLLKVVRGGNIERVDNCDIFEICNNDRRVLNVNINKYDKTVDVECELSIKGRADVMIRYYADAYDYLSIKFTSRIKITAILELNYFPRLELSFADIIDISAIETTITEETDFAPEPSNYL